MLMNGHPQRSMAAFQDALSCIKHAVNDEFARSEPPTTTAVPQPTAASSRTSSPTRPTPPSYTTTTESSCGLTELGAGCTYIYGRPILLEEPSQAHNLECVLSFYSASILFNLALACHHVGITNGRESALNRATLLYKMSIQLLHNCQTSTGSSSELGTAPAVLSLLALNNRAQIHYETCDYVQSSTCLSQMSRILHNSDFLYGALPEDDVEGLLLNVMLLETPSAAHAA